jgi:hypothetical protein
MNVEGEGTENFIYVSNYLVEFVTDVDELAPASFNRNWPCSIIHFDLSSIRLKFHHQIYIIRCMLFDLI